MPSHTPLSNLEIYLSSKHIKTGKIIPAHYTGDLV